MAWSDDPVIQELCVSDIRKVVNAADASVRHVMALSLVATRSAEGITVHLSTLAQAALFPDDYRNRG